jgi:molecular chaperone GrpE
MAWLAGLTLVRERLLQALAAEGIYPIPARGEPFDPHHHIAIEVIPATDEQATGTIVDEYRRGYQVGERILRAAEVVVAKEGS